MILGSPLMEPLILQGAFLLFFNKSVFTLLKSNTFCHATGGTQGLCMEGKHFTAESRPHPLTGGF